MTTQTVPEEILVPAKLIAERFIISGLCDEMYICNRIAHVMNLGNSENGFKKNISQTEIENGAKETAIALQNAYSTLIFKEDIPEIESILKERKLDYRKEIEGWDKLLRRSKQELAFSKEKNPIRVPYLESRIKAIKEKINSRWNNE